MNEDEKQDLRGDDDEPEETQVGDPIDRLEEVVHVVAEQARNHPYRTLGAAFGIGYVLGRGVPSFAMRMLGIAVMRSAASLLSLDMIAQSAWSMAHFATQPRPHRQSHGPNGRDRGAHDRPAKGR